MQSTSVEIMAIIPIFKPKRSDIKNIIKYSKYFDECIVVDDSGNNIELFNECNINDECKIVYLYNDVECGLSKTVNRGIEKAISEKASWVMVINQDNRIYSDIISVFREYILFNDTTNIALLAPQYNYDRHQRKSRCGYKNIKYADMAGSVININVWKKIGGYDTRFFIDGLDIEWCLRVRKEGYRIIQCCEAVLEHHPGETRTLSFCGYAIFKYGWHTPVRYYYQFKAAFLLHNIYHNFMVDLFNIYKFFKVLFLFDNKIEYLKMIILARNDFLNNKFGKYSIDEEKCKKH